jgi:hypothetical protein
VKAGLAAGLVPLAATRWVVTVTSGSLQPGGPGFKFDSVVTPSYSPGHRLGPRLTQRNRAGSERANNVSKGRVRVRDSDHPNHCRLARPHGVRFASQSGAAGAMAQDCTGPPYLSESLQLFDKAFGPGVGNKDSAWATARSAYRHAFRIGGGVGGRVGEGFVIGLPACLG